MEDKYISCMVMHAIGDTIGFKNGEWEFMSGGFEKANEKLYEFIELGGVNNISFKDWRVSDDTIMHIQTAVSLLENYNSINTFGQILKKNFLDAYEQFLKEGLKWRYPGISTMDALKLFKDGAEWSDIPYNVYSGGSGASMRSLCIGLAYYGETNRDQLVQISIESGRMTNNSTVGYLGAFASALFASLAIEGKEITEWPFILYDMLKKNEIIDRYMIITGRDVESYNRDKHDFIGKWYTYMNSKFDDKKKPIHRRADKNVVERGKLYHLNYGFKKQRHRDKQGEGTEEKTYIGSGGDDSVIIAYDALLDAGNNWEKLIVYAMLHMGDTDTTGCIAAGLYGILYGMDKIPENYFKDLEYKKELINIGKKLYKKFYKE